MSPQLKDGCIGYLLEAFFYYDLKATDRNTSPFHRMTLPLISRRYFVQIFTKESYCYRLQFYNYIVARHNYQRETQFGLTVQESGVPLVHQKPMVSLLKMITVTPEVEPLEGREDYCVVVDGNVVSDSRQIMRMLYDSRIPAQYMSYYTESVVTAEFNDYAAQDFTYPAHALYGESAQLLPFTLHSGDPRIFADVVVTNSNAIDYAPHIFEIKTKKLSIYLDNLIWYDDLPEMPYLTELSCSFGSVGLTIKETVDFYSAIAENLVNSCPNLTTIKVSCQAHVSGDDLGDETLAGLFRAVESALEVLKKYVKDVIVDDFYVAVKIPESRRGDLDLELTLRTEEPVPELFDNIYSDVYTDYYMKMLHYLYYNESDVPKHLLGKCVRFRAFLEEGGEFEPGKLLEVF
ncbi:unnamed protein product [Bursaphelenchus xylophilus]|uniref:(pine wood nematode) hypothetical protein n=1 Tax=Bursaphelenchus xylophilus TaxID=6326 RepID=A0A1I7SB07_BURXY|nr:unnamed protein product [Bursaphelenchus xylophilus]CAG9105943.1 unnamed protein product [Bursaphelenchus xylophilus]